MSDDDTRARLAELLRVRPDTSPIEAVARVGADPNRWLDVVENALNTPDPVATLRGADLGGGREESDADAGTDADAEDALDRPTPRVNTDPTRPTPSTRWCEWRDVDFSTVRPDTYPPEHHGRTCWMGRLAGEKMPFSPWADRDHPDAAPDDDARFKWGLESNYADGDTVAIAEDDHRLGGRVLIQRESDPYAFVDGDDVRDPDTGEVHPAFVALLEHLGRTYADVSTSGAGVHAYYRAESGLPLDGRTQATFDIDTEPWGSNDTPPTVEIYTGKHVCVTTGDRVAGTPLDVVDWNADPLAAVLDAAGFDDDAPVSHDTDRDRPDLQNHTPDAVDADDTAEDVRDVLKAVDRLRPIDLPLSTTRTGEDSGGWSMWDPSYRSSESGESLHLAPGGDVFHDHKTGEAFGVLALFAAEEGIIRDPWDRLEGGDWWEAVDAARDADAPIPEFAARDAEPTAVLPPTVRDLSTASSGWDWRHAGTEPTLSIDDARDRTSAAIGDAYGSGDRVLIEALPTMGKSYGSVKAAVETGEPVTILTGRGRKEQYEQFRGWCDDHGLTHRTLPAFTRDCETANGEHGEEWADTVREWYSRGATPKAIHAYAEDVLGRPLPCQAGEGGCTYAAKWDFDPDTDGSADPEEEEPIDVLIGHYAHAHKPKVTTGRTVVIDEFPAGAYETTLGHDLQAAVSRWVESVDAIPFGSYTDLLENRSDDARRADALLWFKNEGIDADERHVFDDPHARADAPFAVFTLLAGEDLGNGVEHADLGSGCRGVFDRANGEVSILRPPDLQYASGVVALDGTPTKRMWELALGEGLNHRPVLQDAERAEYVRDTLNLNIVRTTEYVKPYNSADHVHAREDAALLDAIREEHGERPGLITTSTAEHEYDGAGILDAVDDTKHYGNVLGSNEFKEKRVGAVIGSNHYGDQYIKKWGAYAGESVLRGEGKGADLSYGPFGDDVLQHMREHETLQAAMRFGRDGNGAVVYVHTNTLPEWVPLAGEGRVTRTRTDAERAVLDVVAELEEWRTADVAEHPSVSVGERQVFNILDRLAGRDDAPIDRRCEGRGYTYRDDGIHEVNEHGEVTLDPVDLDDADTDTVREIARSSTYTWDFLNMTGDAATGGGRDTLEPTPTPIDAVGGGDTPPDPGD